MSALFDFLYQEYCRARLAEMRKQLWLSAQSLDIPEARDVSNPVGSTDRESRFGDETTGPHEARNH
jgi:hypothetical protein